MKCRSCDCILSDDEAIRKSDGTLIYFDLCDNCFTEAFSCEDDLEELIIPLEEDEDV